MITDAMVEAAKYTKHNGFSLCALVTAALNGQRMRSGMAIDEDEVDEAADAVIRAALSAALPAAWQDIETAPRDGTEFDAWVQRTPERPLGPVGRVCNVKWLNGSWAYRTTLGSDWYLDGKVTHWMPLPAPPADGGGR